MLLYFSFFHPLKVNFRECELGGCKLSCRGFNKSQLPVVYRPLQDLLPPSVWMPRTLEIAYFKFFLGEGGGACPQTPREKGPCGPFSGHSHLLPVHLQWPLITDVIETPEVGCQTGSILWASTLGLQNEWTHDPKMLQFQK